MSSQTGVFFSFSETHKNSTRKVGVIPAHDCDTPCRIMLYTFPLETCSTGSEAAFHEHHTNINKGAE